MKRRYFTLDNIQDEAAKMLIIYEHQRRSKMFPFKPEHSALLVLDMQRYFLEPESHAYIPSAPAIIPGIQRLVNAYYLYDLPVIFTRHLNSAGNAKMMGLWWRDVINIDNPLSELIPQLDLSKGTVLHKKQYDAFFDSDLEKILEKKAVKQLLVCGVMTHLCCETTARSAFMRGYEVFFPVDGSATYNKQFHNASLLNLAHGFACLCSITDLLEMMAEVDVN